MSIPNPTPGRPDLDAQAAAAADDAAQRLLGEAAQAGLAPIIQQAIEAARALAADLEARAQLANVAPDVLQRSLFRELVAAFQYRLLDAVTRAHAGHRRIFYQCFGEVCDRLADIARFVTNQLCQGCRGTGELAPNQTCPGCTGSGRVPNTGDQVAVRVEVGFAEGAPGAPANAEPGGTLFVPPDRGLGPQKD